MQLFILAVGKGRRSAEHCLAEHWLSRISEGGSILEIESKLQPGTKRTSDEGKRLIRALPVGAALAVLDPSGIDHSSEDLASLINYWGENGFGSAAFAIGGADGHSEEIRLKAHKIISFGRATWPHMLCRAMLAEQLYRASTILKGLPYHRSN